VCVVVEDGRVLKEEDSSLREEVHVEEESKCDRVEGRREG
jgi:hypothetical protein